MALWDDVKKNMVDWYGVAADKTNELAKVGVRRYDIFGISRDIERQFSEMGSLVYTALNAGRTDFADDSLLLGFADRVRALEKELKDKKSEIEEIRRQDRAASAGTTAGTAAGSDDLDLDDEIDVEIYETGGGDDDACDEEPENNG